MISLLQGIIYRLLQLHLHVTRDFTHPEHHPGEDHHRYHGNDTFEQLLLFLREFTGGFIDQNAQAQTERSGEENPYPHHPNPASALGSLQITGDEANNEGRFQAFA